MKTNMQTVQISKKKLWTGRILNIITGLFMLLDSITKFLKTSQVPFTSILGAIIVTGYPGGALTSNFSIISQLFSNTLFPVYFAIILWGALFLRDNLICKLIFL
jgi:hypothetical protein